jgi:hypothetical protein
MPSDHSSSRLCTLSTRLRTYDSSFYSMLLLNRPTLEQHLSTPSSMSAPMHSRNRALSHISSKTLAA